MGKRYYCDYCDKSFADNPTSRKTHLSGNAHIQNRKAHYAALRAEEEILQDDQSKKPCRAYLSSGQCRFGERCQYSHLTNEERARLIELVEQKQNAARVRLGGIESSADSDVKKTLESWTEGWKKRKLQESEESGKASPRSLRENLIPEYKLSENLSHMPNIPPSLLPPSRANIVNSNFSDWG